MLMIAMPAREVAVGVPFLSAVLCANLECSAVYNGRAHRDACPNCGEFGALSLARVLGREK